MSTSLNRRVFLRGAAATGVASLILGNSGVLAETPTTFAILGDYGSESQGEQRVANLISSWRPSFVATTGDNAYSGDDRNAWDVLTRKVGRYYGQFIAGKNFYPALGNHDWGDPGTRLLDCVNGSCEGAWTNFFDLPGNGRYYAVRRGPVHVFVLDDYYLEPHGNSADSQQGRWLRDQAASSDAPWKIVVCHFPPYGSFQSRRRSQWPYAEWGIDAVLSGHHHAYERLKVGGLTYITTGTGGANLSGAPRSLHPDSKSLYRARFGAVRGKATSTSLSFEMIDVEGVVQDRIDLSKAVAGAAAAAGGGAVPDTGVTAPTAGATTDRWPRVRGWATAPDGVGNIDLVIKNTDLDRYWNEWTEQLQSQWRTISVAPWQRGATSTEWSYDVRGGLPRGNYKARAFTRSTQGNGDPNGGASVTFQVN